MKLPWAEPNSRFTALFEGIAIEWLKVASQKAVAEQLGLSWDEIHAIQQRAVERGLARRKQEAVEHIGVDEKRSNAGTAISRWSMIWIGAGSCLLPRTERRRAWTSSGPGSRMN